MTKDKIVLVSIYLLFLILTLGLIFIIATNYLQKSEYLLAAVAALLGIGFISGRKLLAKGHSYFFGRFKSFNSFVHITDRRRTMDPDQYNYIYNWTIDELKQYLRDRNINFSNATKTVLVLSRTLDSDNLIV